MIGLIQRVRQAAVHVDGAEKARIGAGMLVLVGVLPADTAEDADSLLTRMLQYRIFADANDRMNLSLTDTRGDLLLVPQFTLAADTRKGLRPGFSGAAPPEQGKRLFEHLAAVALQRHGRVQTGVFGANMQVSLTNDGPATFWLEYPVR
jgi:D-aminoacyl-tRNA deacylase